MSETRPAAAGWRLTIGAIRRDLLRIGGRWVRWIVARWTAFTSWADPVIGVISPIGWFAVVGAVVSAVLGFGLGWSEFSYLALTLAAALLVSVAFLFGRASYRVTVELTPERVVVGQRALGRIVITNALPKRSMPSRMELPVGRGTAEFAVPALDSEAEHEELFAVPTNRRAVIVAGPAVSVRGDQVGLLRRTVKWSDPIELFVHPLTARLAPSATGLVKDLEGQATRVVTDTDISFHALREYQPGDPLRNVHWRTSARTGQLMVRQYEETRRSQLLMLFSTERALFADEQQFEFAVSVMASLSLQVIRDDTKLDVVTEDHRLATATPIAFLDDTCRIEQVVDRYPSQREFARIRTRRLGSPSVLMQVVGSTAEFGDLRRVGTLFGRDVRRFIVRCEPGAVSRMGDVGDITIITIGALDELPRVMARVAA